MLLPGETIKIPVYFAGLRPFDLTDLAIPFQLGVVDSTDTDPVDWSSLKASLQPTDVPDAAWDQIFTNLLSQVGTTWGQFVTALDNNAAYLGSLGENVTDVDKLWGFMYSQANDALGPVEHLQTVFDASLPLPNGGTLSFWRNYHLPISGRFATGMLGNGWSVPYQSSLTIDASGDAELRTVGESTEIFLGDNARRILPLGRRQLAREQRRRNVHDHRPRRRIRHLRRQRQLDVSLRRARQPHQLRLRWLGKVDLADRIHRPVDYAQLQRRRPAGHADHFGGRRHHIQLRPDESIFDER